MTVQSILAIFGAMVVVAGITVVVTNANSAAIIRAFGAVFTRSLRAAMGR